MSTTRRSLSRAFRRAIAQAERDEDPVRGDERARRNRDRPQHAAPSTSGFNTVEGEVPVAKTIHAIIDN
jgi:hypothetical protein